MHNKYRQFRIVVQRAVRQTAYVGFLPFAVCVNVDL